MTMILEVCVDDARGLDAAIAGGADRIELCSALSVGGLTPSPGLMRLAAQALVPVYAMIRPRAGGFIYGEADIRQMEADIAAVREAGLAGIVIGASRADGTLDAETLRRLLAVARMPATLHRAIDLVPDLPEAVETAISLGFERILTSGGKRTALEGLDGLQAMISRAAGRIIIMPGSGISTDNVGAILGAIDTREVHASCSSEDLASGAREKELGFASASMRCTDTEKVRALKALLA